MADSVPDQGRAADLERLRNRIRERLAGGERKNPGPRRIEPERRPRRIGLSCAQQRLWYLDQEGAGAAYNLTVAIRLRGQLDSGALHLALNAIVERHETLRTVFVEMDGEPVQMIRPDIQIELTGIDLSSYSDTIREERLRYICTEESRSPFALAVEPPLRCKLVVLGATDHALVLTAHHIAMDGWSRGILLRELLALYEACRRGRGNPLPALPIHFSDYALWQRDWVRSDAMQEHISYWRSQLLDSPNQIELPTDRLRPRSSSYRGGSTDVALDARVTREIKKLARSHDATVFMVLQAAFAIVLSRLSGQDDLVIGTPIANRNWEAAEGLIGCFVNTLALRTRIQDDTTVAGLIDAVRQTTLDAYRHQDLPFEQLVEALQRPRRPGCSPVFQVMFGLQNTPRADMSLPGLNVDAHDVRNQTAVVDLTLFLQEKGDVIVGTLNYSADLFDHSTIERWAGYFQTALAAMVLDPGQRTAVLPLQSPQAGLEWVGRFNSSAPRSRIQPTVHARFEEQVAQNPHAVAVIEAGLQLDYAQLNARANQLACYLRLQGVQPRTYVPVLMPRCLDMLIAQLALLKLDCTYVPIDPDIPQARQEVILRDCAAAAAICAAGITRVGAVTWIDVAAAATAIAACAVENPNLAVPQPAPALVMYTSGSTGVPKGVVVPHSAVIRLCVNSDYISVAASDCIAHCSNPAFDACTFEIWAALLNGARVLIVPHFVMLEPTALEKSIVEQAVTIMFLTTALFNQCVRASESIFGSLRYLLFGGETADPGAVNLLLRRGSPLHLLHMYGPTEATTFASAYAVTSVTEPGQSIPIGRPISGARIYVLDPGLQPVPVGVVGEIHIGGEGVARGYLNRPELTAQRFLPDRFSAAVEAIMYKSGDRGRWHVDGNLEYSGRTDRQVKIRGFRVETEEIETQLMRHEQVGQAAVVALELIAGERQLVAYVTAAGAVVPQSEDLRAYLQSRLPGYMIPTAILLLQRMPLNPSGKLDRRALPKPDMSDRNDAAFVAARTATESALCELWEAVLAVKRVGVTDNFFLLGGNSLSAVRLVNLIKRQFGLPIPLRQFMAEPTVEQLALHLSPDQLHSGQTIESITPDLENQFAPFPLTPIQLAYWVGRNGVAELSNVGAHAYAEINVPRIDAARFEEALNRMVMRHAALRTVVLPNATQQVLATVPRYRVQLNDFRQLATRQQHDAIATLRAEMSHQVFAGDTWPLFDIRISRLTDEKAIVHWSLDALVLDASSAMILLDEFLQVYLDPAAELAPLQLSFRDYVLAREAFARSGLVENAKTYWLARAGEFPARPDLPVALDPAQIGQPRFERRSSIIPADKWQELVALARSNQITPTVLLLSCFAEVLSRWTQQPNFALNLTLFNRIPFHPQVEAILGDFTTLVLLAISCKDRSVPFVERLRVNQQQLWADLEHRYFDGMEMLQALRKLRGPGASYPIVVTSTLGLAQGRTLSSLRNRISEAESYSITQTSQVWLDVQFFEQDSGLRCNWDSVVGLFPEGMLDAMFASFNELLGYLRQVPDCWQRPLEIDLPPAQLRTIEAANATAFPMSPGMLHAPVMDHLRTRALQTAVRTRNRALSYGELELRSRQLANRLLQTGARPNQPIAIVMNKCWQQVVAVMGILRAGAAYLPIDANLPLERISLLLDSGQVHQIVTAAEFVARCPPQYKQLYLVEDETAGSLPESTPDPISTVVPTDLAYVIFTSGSTGMPKGVMIEHRAARNTIEDMLRRHRIGTDDCVFGLSNLSFDLSVFDIFAVLGAGGTLVLPEPHESRDPAAWVDWFATASQHEAITIWNTVPALMQLLVDHLEASQQQLQLRLVLLSGDWIPLDLPARIRATLPAAQIISLGGATEASIWSIAYPIGQVSSHWKSIPYGKAMANQSMYVLQDGLVPAPLWVAGDLYIAGAGLARGYWRDEYKSADSFVVHPVTRERLYKTGDRGRLLPDGNIEFLGRKDLQVKIRGYRIELGEIESWLLKHAEVGEAIVMACTDTVGEKRLVAYLTSATEQAPAVDRLRAYLAEVLPDYMVPAAYVVMDKFPLTPNGKVDTKALPAPQDTALLKQTFEAPEGDVEQALAGIWQELLLVQQVGRHDNFFELGGHSLMAVQMVARIREGLGPELPLRDIFSAPRLAALAERVLDRQIAAFDPDELRKIMQQMNSQPDVTR